MDNKGFTLIELIIVIFVLAMLALLSAPNIIKLIEKNKIDNYNSTIDSIVEATKLYVSNNKYNNTNLSFNGVCNPTDTSDKNIIATITLQTLINDKDITKPVKNFCTDEEISNSTIIKVILNCGTRQFSYDIEENTTIKRKMDSRVKVEGIDGLKITYCNDLY